MSDTPNPIQIQKYLGRIDYPASKQQICDAAKGAGADDTVLNTLDKIPDKNYDAPTDVSEAVSDLS